jgi:hypothetical protein
MLTLTKAALHAQRPAGVVNHDHRVGSVGLAGAAEIFDLVSGAKHSIIEHWGIPVEHCASH